MSQSESGIESFYYLRAPKDHGTLIAFKTGRFSGSGIGGGGFWRRNDDAMLLRFDGGKEISLERFPYGFQNHDHLLIESRADFAGFWPTFDPSLTIYEPLRHLQCRIGSTWKGVSRSDVVISGENAKVTSDGGRFVWRHGPNDGEADWFLGTPYIDSPKALHVPHFYDYWSRLGALRPSARPPSRGISFVASYTSGKGDLTARRLDVARKLTHWFPLAVSARIRRAFAGLENVTAHDVPWTLMGKYDFISGYSFNLCFENSRSVGYLTEKPFDALIAGAVPLYEGDPTVGEWIDPAALIDCSGLSVEEIADRIRQAELDQVPERVWTERERLVRVDLDEMVDRIRFFAERIARESPKNKDLATEPGVVEIRSKDRQVPSLSRISVVIKTILRPDTLRTTIDGFIKALGTEVPIIVVDDSPEQHQGGDFPPQVRYLPMPFDIGLSAGRNRGVEAAETEFVFLADDDNILRSTPQEIHLCLKLLDEGWDLIGSDSFDFEIRGSQLLAARQPLSALVRASDATENFFIARTEVLRRFPWNERLKLHPEHEDFFLRLKKEGIRVGGTPLLRFENLAVRPIEYAGLRKRSYIDILTAEWGIDRIKWRYQLPVRDGMEALGAGGPLRLNICAETPALHGWINIGSPTGGGTILKCSLCEELPLESDSIDFIAVDRVLEKLDYPEGVSLLNEVFRILKPSGRLRVATFDLSLVGRLAAGGLTEQDEAYVQWLIDNYLPYVPGYDPSFTINHLMRSHGRRFVYDATILGDALESLGFVDPSYEAPGISSFGELCGVESLADMPELFRKAETLILEVSKSERGIQNSPLR